MRLIDPDSLEGLRDLVTSDDLHFVRDFFKTVLGAVSERMKDIQAAIQKGDAPTLAAEAHALKSSCANAGIGAMTDLCLKLEQTAKAGRVSGAQDLFDQLGKLHEELKTEIAALPEFK